MLTEERVVYTGVIGYDDRMFGIIEVRSQELEDGYLLLASETKSPATSGRPIVELLRIIIELDTITTMVVLNVAQYVYRRP